jgi:ribosomal RNA assembly protein
METIYSEKFPRILKNKKRLEEKLKIKITNRGKEVTISGKPETEYVAKKVIDALNFGFHFSAAMEIQEGFVFEIINIKDHTKRKDLERIRARIIGTGGRTLKTLHDLIKGNIEIKDNRVGIICPPENMKVAQEAIISIVKGAKQGNVYGFLERNQIQNIDDLGLKE